MSKIRIICYNDDVFNRVRDMWSSENRLKRTMLKQFIKSVPFDDDENKGFDIFIITKLIKPEHLTPEIKKNLDSEGFTSKDYDLKVIQNE